MDSKPFPNFNHRSLKQDRRVYRMRPKIAKSKVKGSNDNEVAFSFAWDLPMMAESKHDDQSPPPKSKHYDPKEKLGRTIKYLKQ